MSHRKLSDDAVREIRRAYEVPTLKMLARKHKCGISAIVNAAKRITYANVPDDPDLKKTRQGEKRLVR